MQDREDGLSSVVLKISHSCSLICRRVSNLFYYSLSRFIDQLESMRVNEDLRCSWSLFIILSHARKPNNQVYLEDVIAERPI